MKAIITATEPKTILMFKVRFSKTIEHEPESVWVNHWV